MRYECDVYATCVVPCYKIVFIFRNICMAIGIDVSIYAKTELLLSPQGARIVALEIYGGVVIGIVTVPARGVNCS